MKKQKIIPQYNKKDIEENKIWAAVSYFWILVLLPLFLRRQSPFASFHAKQGLVLFLMEVVGSLLFWIPLLGQLIFFALLIAAIVGCIHAISGKAYELPFIGELANKIHLQQ